MFLDYELHTHGEATLKDISTCSFSPHTYKTGLFIKVATSVHMPFSSWERGKRQKGILAAKFDDALHKAVRH